MKRYIGLIVGFVVVAGGAWYLVSSYSAKVRDAERDAAAQRIRADYLERVGWMRSNPDEKSYKDEVNPFFRAYFNQVDEHLKKYGGNTKFDTYLQELEKREARGGGEGRGGREGGGGGGGRDRKAAYEAVKAVFDRMREGRYIPVWSATDKGLRLDVLAADVKMIGGQPKVSYELVVWGPQRELRDDGKNVKRMITSASFSVSWKLFDEKNKLYGKMDATGDPSGKVDWPERFIAEFPPQMVMGHYDMDLLPAEVKTMEIGFTVSSRAATGGEAAASYTWKLETPAEWKLKPGEKWEGAGEGTASEEEINQKSATK